MKIIIISDIFSPHSFTMADNDVDVNEELLDYEDDPETETPAAEAGAENGGAKQVRLQRFCFLFKTTY